MQITEYSYWSLGTEYCYFKALVTEHWVQVLGTETGTKVRVAPNHAL